MKITTNFIKQTKRHLSASGSILLPLALKWRLVAFMASVILAVLVTPCLAPHMAAAASITLTVPKEPLMFNITPSSGGTFGKSTAGTIKIQTDALAGYTLNTKAKDGKADLTNEATGDKISPISSDVSENDFMSKAAYNNMWGVSFNKQGASNNTFHSIPSDAVGTKIGSTEVPNTAEDIYNIVLGARVDNSLATGAYSNTFIVVASANPVPYKVKYDPNADSDQVSGMPSNNTSATTSTQSFALPSEEPKRSGYEFIGWCDTTPNKESKTVDVCQNGKSYQASDTYTLSKKDETVTFYAMWVDNDHIMQNWKGCATATKNEQITLVDIRDNRPYYVAQLADGNCWMTENLDLFLDENKPLIPETSDVKAEWKPKTTHKPNDSIKFIEDYNHPDSYDPGDICWTKEKSYAYAAGDTRLGYDDGSLECSKHASSHYHFGNFYNFTAAVAQYDTSDPIVEKKVYDTSICPAGWQLPNYEGDKSFKNLRDKSNGDPESKNWVAGYVNEKTPGQENVSESTLHEEPYYMSYIGRWIGFPSYFGIYNVYNTNTAASDRGGCALHVDGSGSINPQQCSAWKKDDFSLRCVSRYSVNN